MPWLYPNLPVYTRPAPATACAGLLADLSGRLLAVEERAGHGLFDLLKAGAAGPGLQAATPKKTAAPARTVAGIGLFGYMFPRGNFLTELGIGVAMDEFTRAVRQAADDPAISDILIIADSPGGSVYGVAEAGAAVADAAKRKPVTVAVDSIAASGAYWVASQASEIVVTPSGEVGSIGVFQRHADLSEVLQREGVKFSLFTAGRLKASNHPYRPLSAEGAAEMQRGVDEYYQQFVKAVADGRRTTQTAVRGGFGEGGMVRAKQAVSAGMADRVATADAVYTELATGRRSSTTTRASADPEIARRWKLLDDDAAAERHRAEVTRMRGLMALDATPVVASPSPPAYTPPVRPPVTEELRRTAYHEAGHAVVAEEVGARVSRVTIEPDPATGTLGSCFHAAASDVVDLCAILHGGAEGEVMGGFSYSKLDSKDAERIARVQEGIGWDGRKKARNYLSYRVREVRQIAAELLEHRTISGDRVRQVMRSFPRF